MNDRGKCKSNTTGRFTVSVLPDRSKASFMSDRETTESPVVRTNRARRGVDYSPTLWPSSKDLVSQCQIVRGNCVNRLVYFCRFLRRAPLWGCQLLRFWGLGERIAFVSPASIFLDASGVRFRTTSNLLSFFGNACSRLVNSWNLLLFVRCAVEIKWIINVWGFLLILYGKIFKINIYEK